jgi:hypothetical protein
MNKGQMLKEGEVMERPAFARTLEEIAAKGADAFYAVLQVSCLPLQADPVAGTHRKVHRASRARSRWHP